MLWFSANAEIWRFSEGGQCKTESPRTPKGEQGGECDFGQARQETKRRRTVESGRQRRLTPARCRRAGSGEVVGGRGPRHLTWKARATGHEAGSLQKPKLMGYTNYEPSVRIVEYWSGGLCLLERPLPSARPRPASWRWLDGSRRLFVPGRHRDAHEHCPDEEHPTAACAESTPGRCSGGPRILPACLVDDEPDHLPREPMGVRVGAGENRAMYRVRIRCETDCQGLLRSLERATSAGFSRWHKPGGKKP